MKNTTIVLLLLMAAGCSPYSSLSSPEDSRPYTVPHISKGMRHDAVIAAMEEAYPPFHEESASVRGDDRVTSYRQGKSRTDIKIEALGGVPDSSTIIITVVEHDGVVTDVTTTRID